MLKKRPDIREKWLQLGCDLKMLDIIEGTRLDIFYFPLVISYSLFHVCFTSYHMCNSLFLVCFPSYTIPCLGSIVYSFSCSMFFLTLLFRIFGLVCIFIFVHLFCSCVYLFSYSIFSHVYILLSYYIYAS